MGVGVRGRQCWLIRDYFLAKANGETRSPVLSRGKPRHPQKLLQLRYDVCHRYLYAMYAIGAVGLDVYGTVR